MTRLFLSLVLFLAFFCSCSSGSDEPEEPNKSNPGNEDDPTELPDHVTLSNSVLMDKIKGGWAGQTIGVTFGGPTEFKYQGCYIPNNITILWYNGYLKDLMTSWPDLYDDLYMDLTFVDVLEKKGVNAPVKDLAEAFAYANYNLWHANQAARYNIVQGVENPGHWLNNPHADDIDFQIEADFIGLMNPGMPNSSAELSDRIGHIMCYGDGWYGGVYVSAMYSLAFVSDNINYIVSEALKAIPEQSKFHECIQDVIEWYKRYPNDWIATWNEIEKKHSTDIGCPDGVFHSFDIDARINAAYVVMGLLYGQGNFSKTMEISTRAGQDSDCNPSTAGGILGTMLGYSNIPTYWKMGLSDIEDMNFNYTSMSLNKVYEISYNHALQMIQKNGGSCNDQSVTIQTQKPEPVRLEQSFEGLYPFKKIELSNPDIRTLEFEFEGNGFVLKGEAVRRNETLPHSEVKANLYLDDELIEEEAIFPTNFHDRRLDIFWCYQLSSKRHKVKIEVISNEANALLRSWEYVIYANQQ